MFGLVLVSDGQNEGPLNNGSDIYCSACSPLVWDNLGLFHMYTYIAIGSIAILGTTMCMALLLSTACYHVQIDHIIVSCIFV